MVTHQLQVERRTGKVRRPETDVLPLSHATNHVSVIDKKLPVTPHGNGEAFSVSWVDLVTSLQRTLMLKNYALHLEILVLQWTFSR